MRPRNLIIFVSALILLVMGAPLGDVAAQGGDARLYILNVSPDTTPKLTVNGAEVPLPDPGHLSEPLTLAAGGPLSIALEYMGFSSTTGGNNVAADAVYLYVLYKAGQAPQGDVLNLAPMLALHYPVLDDHARLIVANQWIGAGNDNVRMVLTLQAGEFAVSQLVGSGAGGSPVDFTAPARSPSPYSDVALITAPGVYSLNAKAIDGTAEIYYTADDLALTAGNITIVAVSGKLPDPLAVTIVNMPMK
ncbi:MAG: hypothetical protein IT323_03415 [Anaerolineae bacterium]|nr:hypothetical protein [Anaerolineae bacterium]